MVRHSGGEESALHYTRRVRHTSVGMNTQSGTTSQGDAQSAPRSLSGAPPTRSSLEWPAKAACQCSISIYFA